ncbi:hypothetical protein QAD02_022152 [Eretmocerus hayati]|uniref:Uncharacterized protein n=1 Tax=Eretmocerus hayati TaxID=131215 RepID=A0ACC2PTB3_9HYME|nr:hypothetical protein QAD02_022152 [Eretmocerus hayati]
MVKDLSDKLWKKCRVVEILSAVMYIIELFDQRKFKRHVDQLRSCSQKLNLGNENDNLPKENTTKIIRIEPGTNFRVTPSIRGEGIGESEERENVRAVTEVVSLDESETNTIAFEKGNKTSILLDKPKTILEKVEPYVRRSEEVRKPVVRLDL